MNTSAAKDFQDAKQLRNDAKTIQNQSAKQAILNAADRLELRGAKKANRIGRKRRKPTSTAATRR